MDVLDLPCNIKDNLSSLVFNHTPDTRDHGVELLLNYSSTPDMEEKVIAFSCDGSTQVLRAESVLAYCESNNLEHTACCRLAWHTVSSYHYSSIFSSDKQDQ